MQDEINSTKTKGEKKNSIIEHLKLGERNFYY